MAIDGSKVKAVNNRDRNFTKGKIASRIEHSEASVARYLDELLRVDRQELVEATGPPRAIRGAASRRGAGPHPQSLGGAWTDTGKDVSAAIDMRARAQT